MTTSVPTADEATRPESPPRHRYAPPLTEQHDIPWKEFQHATRMAVLAGIVAGAFYLSFVLDRAHENVPILWIFTVIAECIVVIHTLAVWMTLVGHRTDIPEKEQVAVIRRALITGELETPPVDVFICHATEPLDIVLPTMIAAQEMVLPHNTWVCDDGRNDDLRDACVRIGVGYLRRETNRHAKAGNLNSAINRTSGRFIVVLDADHIPRPDMLLATLPELMANPSVAMVQTPQTYTYEGRGMVAEGAAVSQELFYEALMPAKNNMNAGFCVGTNVVFRRKALESLTVREVTPADRRKIRKGKGPLTDATGEMALTKLGEEFPRGGIWVGSNSEDVWTSLELHKRGWRTIFLPKVLTQGLTPETITAFLKQQFRWASGGWEVLLWSKMLRNHRLTLSQKMQYLMVPSHYALSAAMAIFAFMAPIYILADRSPIKASVADWALHYLPFYILALAVPFIQAGRFRPSAIIVSMAAVPAHVKAFWATLTRRQASWVVTNGSHGGFSLRALKPQMVLLAIDVLCLVVVFWFGGRDTISLAIATCFIIIQLVTLLWLLIGSEKADRLAMAAEAAMPSDAEALDLLDEYLAERNYGFHASREPVLR